MNERLWQLLEAYLENRLITAEVAELRECLRTSAEARRAFWDYVEQHALIEDILAEANGRDLALAEEGKLCIDDPARLQAPVPRRQRWIGIVTVVALAACVLIALGIWLRPGAELPPEPDPAPGAARWLASAPVATVRPLAGDVQVMDTSGKATAVDASIPLSGGEGLVVGEEDSRAEVLFPDGTHVILGAGTNVRFPSVGLVDRKRLYVEKGTVQVQAAEGSRSPLIVTTDHARIAAAATRFRLYREPAASRVELEEGSVRLESLTGAPAVDVPQGSFVVATDGPNPMVPQSLAPSHCRLRHTFLRGGDAAVFTRDGYRLVASHFARGLRAWDTQQGRQRAAAPGSGQWTTGLTFATDATVVGLGKRGTAMFWHLGEAGPIRMPLRDRDVRCGAVSDDGRWIAQGVSKSEVVVWEADAEKGTVSLRRTFPIRASRVALSSIGPLIAVSRWGGEILVFDVKTGRDVARHNLSRTPTPLALSANGRFVAAYANMDGLVLFDQQTGTRQTLWAVQGARVGCLCFSADGRLLLAGLDDGTARAWATADGKALFLLDTGNRFVNHVAMTADRSLVATIGDSDCVKVWECNLPEGP